MTVPYDVQEMLVSLLLFSIGYVVMLILLLLGWGLYRALASTGPCATFAQLRVHQAWAQVEHLDRIQLHRSGIRKP
jgi:hypothetical protein